jgi:hypothetical protein
VHLLGTPVPWVPPGYSYDRTTWQDSTVIGVPRMYQDSSQGLYFSVQLQIFYRTDEVLGFFSIENLVINNFKLANS